MNQHGVKPLQQNDYFIAVAIWALLILRYGYSYGSGDHVELLPYTRFLADSSYYSRDFFIQALHSVVPNERTIFAHLLLPFIDHLEVVLFLLHFFTTCFLLLGLKKFGTFYLTSFTSWVAVFISVLLLNDKALGNVDLYTPSIQASDVACAVIIWALIAFFQKKYWRYLLLMIVASFLHVLETLDVLMLMSPLLGIETFWRKSISLRTFILLHLAYGLTGGIYLLLILKGKSIGQSTLASSDMFNILFVFRHPHHFIFSLFPLFNKLLFLATTMAGLMFFYLKRSSLFWFFFFGCIGTVVYIIATDVFHFIPIANFQFYKVSQWMKVFGIMSGVGIMGMLFPFSADFYWVPVKWMSLVIVLLVGLFVGCNVSPFHAHYQIGNNCFKDPAIAIAVKAEKCSNPDALFVIPFSDNTFKYWSKRSAFIEFKANVRNKMYMGEWYRRIQLVYGIDTTDIHIGFEKHWPADINYAARANSDFCLQWKKEGVSHILIEERLNNSLLTLLDSNEHYFIYKIN
jgi:hypothetical protein